MEIGTKVAFNRPGVTSSIIKYGEIVTHPFRLDDRTTNKLPPVAVVWYDADGNSVAMEFVSEDALVAL
jgi:hypothetical protein